MPVNLSSCSFSITGSATLQDQSLLIHTPTDPFQIGADGFDALAYTLEDGVEDGQANQMYVAQVTVPAGGAVSLDLADGSLENFRGESIVFSAIKIALFSIADADGVKRVYVGPQGDADGCQLWFNGTGADAAEEVIQSTMKANLLAGWTVGQTGSSVLVISSPDGSGDDVVVNVLLIGVSA